MKQITFKNDGTEWSGYNAAEKWLKENGYSIGSMQSGAPTAVVKGEGIFVSKWRNLSEKDRISLDGHIVDGDARNGDITVNLKDKED